MTNFFTRFSCAMLSVIGAAGLVTFVDPASAVGSVRTARPAAIVAAATPTTTSLRG